jgi:hypothetical protein
MTSTTDPPVYKWSSAFIRGPSPEIIGDSNSITGLLDRKVREASEAMKLELNNQLFGQPKKERNFLRQCIADAVDEHMPPQTSLRSVNEVLKDAYLPQLKENIFGSPSFTQQYPTKEEMKVSDLTIASEAVRKRKEARAEAAAESIGDFLEGMEWSDGDTTSWEVSFHDTPDKTYHYVALRGGARWYITGDGTKYTTDMLIEKIVEQHLRATVTSPDFAL